MAQPNITFSKYRTRDEEQAVKHRWIYTLGFLPNGYIGLLLWNALYHHWTVGAWIVLAIYSVTGLMQLFRALSGWKLWFQGRQKPYKKMYG